MTSEELAKLEAPTGWVWYQKPTLRTKGTLIRDVNQAMGLTTYKTLVKRLIKWAVKSELGLVQYGTEYVYSEYNDYSVVTKFHVLANKPELTLELLGPEDGHPCSHCGDKVTPGSVRCPSCRNHQGCNNCGRYGLMLYHADSIRNRNVRLCSDCAPRCAEKECETRIYKAERTTASGRVMEGKCAAHASVAPCFACREMEKREHIVEVNYNGGKSQACRSCASKFVCPECNTYKKGITEVAGKRMCKACATVEIDKLRVQYEKFDEGEVPPNGLLIPSLPTRPFRLVSIETEVDGDKDVLAGTLFRCGIVRTPEVESYHTHPTNATEWAAHLKHDGSVTGGELISHCLDLSDIDHAMSLLNTLVKLKSLQKLDKIQYNCNCGGHIHIDAHNFGLGDVWRLLTIWNYLEDVIYRLAGAGHSYGHRTLEKGHDVANHGQGYANLTVKGPFGTKGVLGQQVRGQQRMSGLNFVPYMQAIASCTCGAFAGAGDGRNCVCDLGKATIEWRVWNTQGNPRILHAWIAFMQAVHAYADQGEDPTPEWESSFPVFQYTKTKFASCNAAHKATALDRLEWIFKNLMFTNDERDSLIYTIKQSELAELGEAKINALAKIVPSAAFAIKTAPRNPAKRKVPIVVKPPKDGETVVAKKAANARMRDQFLYQAVRAVNANANAGW